jgi:hypothetical protein
LLTPNKHACLPCCGMCRQRLGGSSSISLFFSLSFLKKYSLVLSVFDISIYILFFISNFFSCPFYKKIVYFQFSPSISICHVLFFSNLVFILLFFNFFLWPFCKSFIGFQFYLSIQFYGVLFFSIWSLFFWFFFFCCFSFQFNL